MLCDQSVVTCEVGHLQKHLEKNVNMWNRLLLKWPIINNKNIVWGLCLNIYLDGAKIAYYLFGP